MEAFKCDRCGTLYELYKFQKTAYFYSITTNLFAGGPCMDLCPTCNNELQEWIAKGKEQAKVFSSNVKED